MCDLADLRRGDVDCVEGAGSRCLVIVRRLAWLRRKTSRALKIDGLFVAKVRGRVTTKVTIRDQDLEGN